jgi:hypothetical protein
MAPKGTSSIEQTKRKSASAEDDRREEFAQGIWNSLSAPTFTVKTRCVVEESSTFRMRKVELPAPTGMQIY